MSPLTESTRVVLSRIQQYPAVLGEPWGGGYFAGYISHTADGNPTHALIVAPRETGATGTGYTLTNMLQWKTSDTATANTSSAFDGYANTLSMVSAGIANHPAAQFCVGLSIGGFTDWYLPSLLELDIAYFNLKPSTTANNTGFGTNIYSIPRRDNNNTTAYPTQTGLIPFNTSTEGFVADLHCSSTAGSAVGGFVVNYAFGSQSNFAKTSAQRVRAFRRIALP